MLMVGPDYATGNIWGYEHPEAAMVCNRVEPALVNDKVVTLLRDADLRQEMAAAAARAALNEFDPAAIRLNFHSAPASDNASLK